MTPNILRSGCTATLVACLLAAPGLVAQRPQAPARAAAPRITLSFAEPHTYAATVDYLKKVAAANPSITDLLEIGHDRANRPVFVLVVSNMKSGVTIDSLVPLQHPRTPAANNVVPQKPYQAKPGQWIDGGTRGGDPAGKEACLYIIDKLVSGYGNDAEITRLVDENAFYVCPIVNDAEASGAARAAADGNFPEGWWKDDNTPGGTGEFPSSSPEAHAVLEFFTNHTNILLVQSFDATGGHSVRPFARWPESRVDARDVAVFDGVLGKKYQELAGQAAAPRVWRAAFNSERQAPAGYGAFYDWAYGQFGAFATATQISDEGSGQAAGGDRLQQSYERAWQFERYKATLLPRLQIKDAQAKVLYTTDSASKAVTSQSGDTVLVRKAAGAPGRYKVVQVTATVENTGGLPTHVGRGPELRGNRQDVIWLLGDRTRITFLQGSRWQPLGVLQGTLPLPRAPRAEAAGRGGRGGGPAGGRGGRGRGGEGGFSPLSQMREQRPAAEAARQTGSTRVVSWLIAVEGDTPLELALTSQKGGTTTRNLAVR